MLLRDSRRKTGAKAASPRIRPVQQVRPWLQCASLQRLMERADDPVHQLRWQWEVDDLAIWDERSTMHRVDTSHWPEPRRMRRCTVS